MKKQADRQFSKYDNGNPRYLQYDVKKTGHYKLHKVIDESGLEVRIKSSEALIVTCPSASIKPAPIQKCKGDLSDLVLQLHGTPPFKLKYSRTVNKEDKTFSFQSIQPESLVSPLQGQKSSGALVRQQYPDVSWARSHSINVPLNESLNTLGHWVYTVDQVHDALGNAANYSAHVEGGDRPRPTTAELEQVFTVHARPRAKLDTKESPCVLKVARKSTARLPVIVDDSGHRAEQPYSVSFRFTPLRDLSVDGGHAADATEMSVKVKGTAEGPEVKEPGLYSLHSISSQFCAGEIFEPTSCLLFNPQNRKWR